MRYKTVLITKTLENGSKVRSLAWCVVENDKFVRLCNSSDTPPSVV